MENKFLKNNNKRLMLPLIIVAVVIIAIVIVLAGNKRKINETMKPVDRSQIPVAVTVAKADYNMLKEDVQYPAVTQPLEEAMLYAQTSGLITYLNVQPGQQVSKGQLLGKLDTKILENNLKAAEINFLTAATNRQKLLDDYNRAKDLYENKAGLEVNMLTARNNYDNAGNNEANARIQIQLIKEQIANTRIIAPISGTISFHKVKRGEFVSPSTPIATISNVAIVKATAFVNQELSYRLKLNETAAITAPVYGTDTFTGKITFINAVADVNHNYQVDLLVTHSANTRLKGGTDVQVTFNTVAPRKALLIPKSALNTNTEFPYVYVAENGLARKKDISTGIIRNDEVEVLSGLTAGDLVITSGQINITSSSSISIKK